MRRRFVLLAAAAVAASVPALVHGCSNEPPFESVCNWVGDGENCFREFHKYMLENAGPTKPDNPNGDCRTYPLSSPTSAIPTEASPAAPGLSNGAFLKRAMLDTCILNAGGSVTIDPPVDLTMYPLSPYATPTTYTMTFINPDSNPCGTATYTSPHGFSITINPPPDAGTTAMTDAGGGTGGGLVGDDAGPPISNGTFTSAIAPGRDAFDVTCPSGETHHFDLNEINGSLAADAGPCPEFAGLIPEASFQIFLGGTDTPGALSFAIVYPPDAPTSGSEQYPDGGPPLVPDRVVYFNCAIPGATETCADGVKDGIETDVDCGGPQIPSMLQCGNCPPRCEVSQQCICDADCDTDAGLVCGVNAMSGMRQCGPAEVDGGAVTHFPKCAYETDAGAPCTVTGTGGSGAGGSGAGGSGTGGSASDAGSDASDAGDASTD